MKIIKNIFERKDDRGILREYINDNQAWRSINGGIMKKGAIMGNHYHKKCKALLFILAGSADILIKDIRNEKAETIKFRLGKSEGVVFDEYETHAVKFLEDSEFLLFKSEKFDEKDKDLHEARLI